MAQPQPAFRQSTIYATNTCDIIVLHNAEERILKPSNISEFQKLIDAYHCLKKVPFGITGMRNGTFAALYQKKRADPNFKPTNRALADAVVECCNIRLFEQRMRAIYDPARSTAVLDGFTSDPHRVATDFTWLDLEDIPQDVFDQQESTFANQLGVKRA